MIQELTDFYSNNGILSTNFDCKFYPRCNGGTDVNHLVRGKSAYVGREYENHSLPRILFVSLDMGSDDDFESPENRTPIGVRDVEENRSWWVFSPLLHWYETHHFALTLANSLDNKYTQKDANLIFAHTNSSKCCEIKGDHGMSSDVLYENCIHYIKGEVEVLDPDIIVGQGNKAYDAIRNSFKGVSWQNEFKPITTLHDRIHIFLVNDRPVLFLQTIYPSWRNKRTILQREELYPYYLDAVSKYVRQFLPQFT